MNSMYREMILDLNQNPLNYGNLEDHDFSHEMDNPLCGDVVRIDVKFDENGQVADIAWSGDGCAISQVSASLLTDEVKGMTVEEINQLDGNDMLELLGLPNLTATRVKCATLGLKTLKEGAFQMNQNRAE